MFSDFYMKNKRFKKQYIYGPAILQLCVILSWSINQKLPEKV